MAQVTPNTVLMGTATADNSNVIFTCSDTTTRQALSGSNENVLAMHNRKSQRGFNNQFRHHCHHHAV